MLKQRKHFKNVVLLLYISEFSLSIRYAVLCAVGERAMSAEVFARLWLRGRSQCRRQPSNLGQARALNPISTRRKVAVAHQAHATGIKNE
jgi:hypothetical protein